MLRLFAAIPIPWEIGLGLQGRQTGLPDVRWSPLENLHITLRFFGDVAPVVAEDLDAELDQIAIAPFELNLETVGAFGEGADIHAVWAGVAENPALNRLARRCDQAARRVGLKPDARAYRPHVTLAYMRRPDPDQVAAWIQTHNLLRSPPFAVDAFSLYSSHATKHGSRYGLERFYPLGRDRLSTTSDLNPH